MPGGAGSVPQGHAVSPQQQRGADMCLPRQPPSGGGAVPGLLRYCQLSQGSLPGNCGKGVSWTTEAWESPVQLIHGSLPVAET